MNQFTPAVRGALAFSKMDGSWARLRGMLEAATTDAINVSRIPQRADCGVHGRWLGR